MKKVQIFTLILFAIWFGGFAFEVGSMTKSCSTLVRTQERLESTRIFMNQMLSKTLTMHREIQDKSSDQEYLLKLFEFFPQDKGVLRTQKAIADDVQTLRRRISRYVGGSIYILIDTRPNKIYLMKGLDLLWEADCSVGRGGTLVDRKTGRRWEFVTPHGEFRVLHKIANPVWIKPDWAFVETSSGIPPPDDPSRRVKGELGAYVLNLGDGYLIHGTKNEDLLGSPVSHGCVRLGAENLEKLYQTVPVGTKVFIF